MAIVDDVGVLSGLDRSLHLGRVPDEDESGAGDDGVAAHEDGKGSPQSRLEGLAVLLGQYEGLSDASVCRIAERHSCRHAVHHENSRNGGHPTSVPQTLSTRHNRGVQFRRLSYRVW